MITSTLFIFALALAYGFAMFNMIVSRPTSTPAVISSTVEEVIPPMADFFTVSPLRNEDESTLVKYPAGHTLPLPIYTGICKFPSPVSFRRPSVRGPKGQYMQWPSVSI